MCQLASALLHRDGFRPAVPSSLPVLEAHVHAAAMGRLAFQLTAASAGAASQAVIHSHSFYLMHFVLVTWVCLLFDFLKNLVRPWSSSYLPRGVGVHPESNVM